MDRYFLKKVAWHFFFFLLKFQVSKSGCVETEDKSPKHQKFSLQYTNSTKLLPQQSYSKSIN